MMTAAAIANIDAFRILRRLSQTGGVGPLVDPVANPPCRAAVAVTPSRLRAFGLRHDVNPPLLIQVESQRDCCCVALNATTKRRRNGRRSRSAHQAAYKKERR